MDPGGDESANDEHGHGTANGSEDQELATTPFVNEDCEPEYSDDRLDYAEKARSKVDSILTSDAD